MNILVIDDDIDLAQMLKLLITSINRKYVVQTISTTNAREYNGFENCLKANLEETSYDIFIIDCHLLHEDGTHLARHIRNRGISVPIYLLSSDYDYQITAQELNKQYGKISFLRKPFHLLDLVVQLGL